MALVILGGSIDLETCCGIIEVQDDRVSKQSMSNGVSCLAAGSARDAQGMRRSHSLAPCVNMQAMHRLMSAVKIAATTAYNRLCHRRVLAFHFSVI